MKKGLFCLLICLNISFINAQVIRDSIPEHWKKFTFKVGAFEVYLPEKIMEKKIDYQEVLGKAIINIISSTDENTGIKYQVQYLDESQAVYGTDSVYFSSLLSIIKASANIDQFKEKKITLTDFSGTELKVLLRDNSNWYIHVFRRGGRCYLLFSVIPANKEGNPDIATFFNSFHFLPNLTKEWQTISPADSSFSIASPSEFTCRNFDQSPLSFVDSMTSYLSYDEYSGSSFYVTKSKISDYFYANDIKSFFRNCLTLLQKDTIFETHDYFVKQFPATEFFIQNPLRYNLIRICFVLKGNELFSYHTPIPKAYQNNGEYSKFFQSFTLGNSPAKGNIQDRKAHKILTDLLSTDAIIRKKAKTAFNFYTFDASDLPLLYSASLNHYPDDALIHSGSKSLLLEAITQLTDTSYLTFLNRFYVSFQTYPEYQVSLLCALAKMQTDSSRHLLVKLLLNSPPQTSLQLLFVTLENCKANIGFLFPAILNLMDNPLNKSSIISNTAALVLKHQISIDVLRDYYPQIYELANAELKNRKTKNFNASTSLIDILGFINTDEAYKLLNQYCSVNDNTIRMYTVLSMIKAGLNIDQSILCSLARNNETRIAFYDKLQNLGKLSYFPEKFKTQRRMAKGRLWHDLDFDNSMVDHIHCRGNRVILFKGKKQRFYLYKIITHRGDFRTSYFGISGPYPLDERNTTVSEHLPYTNHIIFSEKSMNGHLKSYFESMNLPFSLD